MSTPHAPRERFPALIAALAAITTVNAAPPRNSVTALPAAEETTRDTITTLKVPAIVRDFRAFGEPGGHPDFQRWTGRVRVGMIAPTLDDDAKPVAANPYASELIRDYKDRQGRPINPTLFNPQLGDTAGQLQDAQEPRLDSANSFAQWYRDIPGVNAATTITLDFVKDANSDLYVFDSSTQQPWASRGGFFPINDTLYGNHADTGKNFHFTTELTTTFTVKKRTGQVFTFAGDDDVWVFINGQLVIDLGGVHSEHEQTVELDRLSWLQDGNEATLKVFHAERRTAGSNFRIATTLNLRPVKAPDATALYD